MIKRKSGFTIAEILIAIVVLAVLATIVISRFTGSSERAVVAEAVGMLSAIRQAEAAWLLENPAGYTATIGNLDVTVPADDTTAFNYSITNITAGPPPTFRAVATRRPATDPHGGETITLDQDGSWAQSTHTLHP